MSVMLITDSACGLTPAEAAQMDVRLLPLTVCFGDEAFLDGVTLTDAAFYQKLRQSPQLPTTSQVTPWQYQQQLQQLGAGDEAVILTLSGKLSGTLQSALAAAGEDPRVWVVDSQNVSLGQRVLLEYALRLRAAGDDGATLAQKLRAACDRVQLLGVVETLEYLQRGGRLSKGVALAGGLLHIKPVLQIANGEVALLGKARGLAQSNNLLNQTVAQRGGIDFSLPYAVGYTGGDDTTARAYLAQSAALWQPYTDAVPLYPLGSTIGTHVGPGAVAVAFFAAEGQA